MKVKRKIVFILIPLYFINYKSAYLVDILAVNILNMVEIRKGVDSLHPHHAIKKALKQRVFLCLKTKVK